MKIINFKTQQQIINDEIIFQYVKSSGPGGQNVNKRNTKVQLFFNFQESKYLNDYQKTKLKERYPDNIIIINSHEQRSQKQNKESAIKKLFDLLETKFIPETERIATKIPYSQKQKRYIDKTRQGYKKKIRNKKINLDNE